MSTRVERAEPLHPSGAQRLAVSAERVMRWSGDPRRALILLLAAVGWNVAAAAMPEHDLLRHPAYLVLIAAILLAGMAGVALRLPGAWREWRRPGPVPERGAGVVEFPIGEGGLDRDGRDEIMSILVSAGYRLREQSTARRWGVHATRRGWSRLAGLASHAALLGIVVAAAASGAFAREATFSLLPGEQALLDAPSSGFSDAVRLEQFDAAFDAERRPVRLDTEVTFLRDGSPVRTETLSVNRPGAFGGYLVHGWTYGPAVHLRVTTLAGVPLLDAGLPLDGERGGRAVGGTELPAVGAALGVALVDAGTNRVTVSVVAADGSDAATLRPGQEARVGSLIVALDGMEAYVTFLSRRDPALPWLVGACVVLVASLAVSFWFPRRRLSVREGPGGLVVVLRGERFDDPRRELECLVRRLRSVAR